MNIWLTVFSATIIAEAVAIAGVMVWRNRIERRQRRIDPLVVAAVALVAFWEADNDTASPATAARVHELFANLRAAITGDPYIRATRMGPCRAPRASED